jgi:hypothetical protein
MAGQKADASMNAALQAQCDRIQELLAKAAVDEIDTRYKVGATVRAIEDDASKYGQRAVARVGLKIGYSASALYQYAAVARLWSPDEMEELRARRNGYGEPLLWSHWAALTRAPKTWRRWMEQALAESWPARRLERELDAVSPHRHDSPEDAEDTTRAALEEAIKEAQRSSTNVAAFAAALDRLGRSKKYPPEIGELLARALDLFGDVHRRTGEVVARARQLAPQTGEAARKRLEN